MPDLGGDDVLLVVVIVVAARRERDLARLEREAALRRRLVTAVSKER